MVVMHENKKQVGKGHVGLRKCNSLILFFVFGNKTSIVYY